MKEVGLYQTFYMQDLTDFLTPVNMELLREETDFTDGQIAKHLTIYEKDFPDLELADIILLGIGERRGSGLLLKENEAPDKVRRQLYQLHYWHTDINIADIGNIKTGAGMNDSYAALQTVLSALIEGGKTVIIMGGSHDLTLAQYQAYKKLKQIVEVTCIDALINLRGDSVVKSENFLLDMLTSEPNMIRHYNHIGFQSYFVHPRLLETMDKLRFDCYRLGVVKENIENMEPVIRNSNLMSFDICSISNHFAPANHLSTNGLTGEEACTLTRFAGLSNNLNSLGIYGYYPEMDSHELTAKQISQMIWYFIDGKSKGKQEANLQDSKSFNEYHTFFAEIDTTFLQSRKTNRWWMQMPDKQFIACAYADYLKASNNEIPERWLRLMERSI